MYMVEADIITWLVIFKILMIILSQVYSSHPVEGLSSRLCITRHTALIDIVFVDVFWVQV